MKKYLKMYTKRTLALFMAVMMLMTCWVFVAPEKAEAAAPTNYTVQMDFKVEDEANGTDVYAEVDYISANGTGTKTTNVRWDMDKLESSTGTYSLTKDFDGWPCRIKFVIGNIGMRQANIAITGISINGTKVLSGTWTADLGWNGSWNREFIPNTNSSATADGKSGTVNGTVEGTWSWPRPAATKVSSGLSAANLTVPKNGTAVSKEYTVKLLDNYGVNWTGGGYTCTIDPSQIGTDATAGSLSYNGNQTVTVSFKDKAFTYLKDYSTSTGKGTATLTVKCGSITETATITLQSSTYNITFDDACSTNHTATCYYNGAVSYPTPCTKPADADKHYKFDTWSDTGISNITADKTITATYKGTAHDYSGAVVANGDGTHSLKCTSVGSDATCTYVGLNKEGVPVNGASESCSTDSWGGDNSSHKGTCTVCSSNLTHTPDPQNKVDAQYLVSYADCDSPAVYYKSCSVCGQALTNQTFTSGSAAGHSYVVIGHVDPTCTTNGYDIYGCENCDKAETIIKEFDDAGNALYRAEHKWYHRTTDKEDGTHGVKCTVCSEWKDVEKHGFVQQNVKDRADCLNDAVYNFRCPTCQVTTTSKYAFDADTREFTDTIITPALGHTGGTAYCNEKAVCSRCNNEYGEFDPDNHKATTDHEGLVPTCSAEGYTAYKTCNDCGTEIGKTTLPIDATAHQYASATSNGDGTHSAVCQLNASHVVKDPCTDEDKNCVCDICGYNIPHVYDKTVATEAYLATPATCTDKATYYYSCQCGVSSKGTASEDTFAAGEALGHNYTEESDAIRSEATCTAAQTNWFGCLRCDANAKDDADAADKYYEVGSPLGHDYTPNADKSNIVNNNDGTHSYYCNNNCNTFGGAVACTYGAWDKTNADGHQRTCTDCGYTTAIEAHKWDENNGEGWKPSKDNTGSAAGQMERECLICSRVETTPCVYDKVETFAATCIAPKRTEYKCTTCGHGYTVTEGTKLDHSYTGDVVTDADNKKHGKLCVNGCALPGAWVDCTLAYSKKDGDVHGVTCSVCNYVYDDEACSGGEATCIAYAVCSKCGDTYGSLKAHVFEGAAKNAAYGEHYYNCTTDGCTAYGVGSTINATVPCNGGTAYCDAKAVCQECNAEYGTTDPDNHKNTTNHDGLAPTCMQEGYTAYKTCDACDKVLGKEIIPVDPTAHKYSETATSTNDGKHYYACEYNAEHKDVHNCFCSDPVIKAPTCLDGGYTINVCDECPYEWHTEPTKATDHSWGAWTPDGNGGHTRVCLNDKNHVDTGVCANDTSKVKTAPTCTAQGYTTYTCKLCAHSWKADYVDATGHTYTQKIVNTGSGHLFTEADYAKIGLVDSECTNADYYWFDCKDCDKNGREETDYEKYPLNTLYYENGSADGHNFTGKAYKEAIKDKLILATPATCTDNETYYTYCVRCYLSSKGTDKEATFTRGSSAIQHSYENIVNENDLAENRKSEATCTAKAVYYKSCANCGDVSEDTFRYGEILAHDYTKKNSDYAHRVTAANCQTQATYWYSCKTCNSSAVFADTTDMTEEEIAALKYTDGTVDMNKHVAVESVAFKAPTCTEDGHSAYSKCSACGTEIVKKVTVGYEKTGHSYTGAYRIANVVDGEGNVTAYKHQRACVYGCGEYSDVTDCGFTAWKQNADGKTHSKSCVCGNEITGDCEANNNASCVDAATCKYCGSEMAGTTTGHNWGAWTSDENGKTHSRVCLTNSSHKETENCGGGVESGCGAIFCSVCNQQYATGAKHTWGDWSVTTPATCTAPAEYSRACTACSATETKTEGAALGHKYDKDGDGKADGVVTTPATCTTAGVMTYTCVNNCGEKYTEVIKALDHKLAADWETVTEPTCAEEGYQIKKCERCDYFEDQTIPKDKSKHVPGEWEADESASNCSTGVKYYKYCTVCGLKVDEKTEKVSHVWVAASIVYATCTENGYINMVCDNCGSSKRFDEKTPGFPNSCDETTIDEATAKKLISKKAHTYSTTPSGDAEHIFDKDGTVIYIKEAATCTKTGKGYKVCTVDGCGVKVNVTLDKAAHVYKTMPASEATCQTPGHSEYLACRNCSYTTEPTTTPKLGHIDIADGGDGKCDRCKFEMYTTDNGGTSACGCMCHNSSGFIKNLIYPIARFFWKLFKTNKSCSCGAVHY